jgi:hypothetical protein
MHVPYEARLISLLRLQFCRGQKRALSLSEGRRGTFIRSPREFLSLSVACCSQNAGQWALRPRNNWRIAAHNNWEEIVMRAKAAIGYHGVISAIPPSDLPTLSVVGEGEVTISIKHL